MSTVSTRARQLNHRLKNRKNAIISRREAEASSANEGGKSSLATATSLNLTEKASLPFPSNGEQRTSESPTSGFVAVNSRPSISVDNGNNNNGYASSTSDRAKAPGSTLGNGKSVHTASPATRAELLGYFTSPSLQSSANEYDQTSKHAASSSRPFSASKAKSKSSADVVDYAAILLNSASPVPIPNTPSSLLHYNRPSPADRFDDSGPYKAEMLARMDQLQRGDRVIPPCDRCRRLHMDCNKNLTACLGCTKKHAKCSWKDVTDKELRDNPYVPRSEKEDLPEVDLGGDVSSTSAMVIDDPTQGVRDEELLGEDGSDDSIPQSPSRHIPDQILPNNTTDESVSNLETPQIPDMEITPSRDNTQPSENNPHSSETTEPRASVVDPAPNDATPAPAPSTLADHATNGPPYENKTFHRTNDKDNISQIPKPPNISTSTHLPNSYPSCDTDTEAEDQKTSASPQRAHDGTNNHQGTKDHEQADRKVWTMLSKYEHHGEEAGAAEDEHDQRCWGPLASKIGADGGG